jgi:protein gp37
VFVNSMSDLFHEGVTDEQIAAVFGVMAACPQHRFQLLTKRPKRMLEWFEWMVSLGISAHRKCIRAALDVATTIPGGVGNAYMNRAWEKAQWPLPNVDLYVSIEDQATADERIPLLLQTPAAVRGVSAEPLLASIDFGRWVFDRNAAIRRSMSGPAALNREQADASIAYPLDHVIVGGESGPSARPCNVEWIRSIVNQCQAAGVACFVKQLGANYVDARNGVGGYQSRPDPLVVPTIRHLKHRKGGDMSEWPEDLRVREYPEVAR